MKVDERLRSLTVALAAALVALALAAPVAPAVTAEQFLGPQSAQNACELWRDTHGTRPARACEEQLPASRPTSAPSATEVAAVSPVSDSGFSWGAAAIGASTVLGLLILASLALLAVSRRDGVRTAR